MDHRLIIVTGMSGAGKSTISKSIAHQIGLNGIRQRWLHEEMRGHPIRDGEFTAAPLNPPGNMERNIQDMFQRWDRLVRRILRAKSVYVMEGVLFDNIIRYFFVANTPAARILRYYEELGRHIQPANPVVVFLDRSDPRATLEANYPLRGSWWKNVILSSSDYRYIADRGMEGEEGVYRMYQEYASLSNASFQRMACKKIRIDTQAGEWEIYRQRITRFLGLDYIDLPEKIVENPEQYCGVYTELTGDQRETIEINYDGKSLYCKAFWPYMKLIPLGRSRFEFASFPVNLAFIRGESGNIVKVKASGNYDWDITGKTLYRE
jgi:hypothetical protein